MSQLQQCEFFLLRYVPDPVKEEFVNIGVVLMSHTNADVTTLVRFTTDWRRVRCFDPDADLEMLGAVESKVATLLATATNREELLRLVSETFSAAVAVSDPKRCLTESPEKEIDVLARMYL